MSETKTEKRFSLAEIAALVVISPFAVAIFLLALIPSTFICAWCDMHIWNWFAAPYFHLLPMSLWVAIGIGYWMRMQTFTIPTPEQKKAELWKGIIHVCIYHLLMLALGACMHYFMHGRITA